MNYNEALNLFGFTNNFTKEELKKRYLELSKKYHPDLNGDEEMMKKVNMAYEILKKHNELYDYNACSKLIKYYDDLKSKLTFYASKTIYLPDTLEFKYANAIADVIDTFTFDKGKQLIEFKYTVAIGSIKDLFKSYKKEILKNVPEFWISKFEPINDNCSFDAYVNEVNKIRTKYEKVDKNLDKIILSMFKNKKVNSKILEEIVVLKEIILKEIVDEKITIEDGIYRLQAEIKARILKDEELNNKMWDTYKAIMNNFNKRMMELKPTDTENIDIAMKVFNEAMITLKAVQNGTIDEKVLFALGNLTFVCSDELKRREFELYITANVFDGDKPEIVLKVNEDEKNVYYVKKLKDGSIDKLIQAKKDFYSNYRKLKEYLEKATFWGIRCFVRCPSLSPQKAILLCYCGGIAIVLLENGKLILVDDDEFIVKEPYDLVDEAKEYISKQTLYDKIYDSFFEREEKIKFKNNENNILKREKNK